jgi:sec-independent protein translocase protein TatC
MFASLLKFVFKKREETAAAAVRGDDDGEVVKPFLDHLEDLRWTIVKIAVTIVISMALSFVWHKEIFHFLELPLVKNGLNPKDILVARGVITPFMAALSLSFYAGIVVAFPFLVYFLGDFVLPALTKKEKRYVLPAIGVGFLLFVLGAWFCFQFLVPAVIKFMANFATESGIKVQYDVKDYFGLVAMMCIAFGLLCQLPVVMVTLNGIGVVTYKWIASTRSYAVAAIFVLVAVVSPAPDVASILMFAVPLLCLYEICIWIIWYLDRNRAKRAAEEARKAAMPYDDPNEPID